MNEVVSPQTDYFEIIKKLRKANQCIFYLIFILSIASVFATSQNHYLATTINIINLIAMISYPLIGYSIDYYLFPNAEKVRRSDFFDNSFGTAFNISPSEKYFTNDDIINGLYKMSVNLFENTHFTYNISKKMRVNCLVTRIPLIIVITSLAFYGFKDNQIAIPFFQLFLSVNIVGELIKLFFFVERNEIYLEDLKRLFSINDFSTNCNGYTGQITKLYTDYESNLAWGMIALDSKLYEKLNPKLSKDWNQMKIRYKIER